MPCVSAVHAPSLQEIQCLCRAKSRFGGGGEGGGAAASHLGRGPSITLPLLPASLKRLGWDFPAGGGVGREGAGDLQGRGTRVSPAGCGVSCHPGCAGSAWHGDPGHWARCLQWCSQPRGFALSPIAFPLAPKTPIRWGGQGVWWVPVKSPSGTSSWGFPLVGWTDGSPVVLWGPGLAPGCRIPDHCGVVRLGAPGLP